MRFLIEGYRRLLTHPRYGIWILLATLAYVISPIDLSPDLIPLLGQIDDVALIVLLLSVATQWLSQYFLTAGAAPDATPDPDASRGSAQTIDVEAVEVDAARPR